MMRTHTYNRTDSVYRQRGATLVEAAVVFPIFIFAALAVIQIALVFYAKSNINYAAYEAARAGSVDHASVSSITTAFTNGLVPYYGGGRTETEIRDTLFKISDDMKLLPSPMRVEIISPTKESFEDYSSPKLKAQYKTSELVIPNVGLDVLTCPRDVSGCKSDPKKNQSGQTLLDANVLKLRITYGIPKAKQMPLVGRFYTWALGKLGAGAGDPYKQSLIDAGRIPVVVHTTLRMQSDPIRNSLMISSPGPGNGGKPQDPGPPPTGDLLPTCGYSDASCSTPPASGGPSTPPACRDGVTLIETAAADVLFDFGKATLDTSGKKMLDDLIAEAKTRSFESLTLTGYTDPLGDAALNDKLSLDRAKAVRDYLTSHGFPSKPITVVGKGSKDLIKTETDCPPGSNQISCLAPDRRVVFTFEKVKG